MPKYNIFLSKTAQRQLDRFKDKIACKLIATIQLLSDNPRPHGYIKLKDREAYRIRQGDYRIIYEIFDNHLVINVIALGHRKDVYD
ncbi:MAG: type II toxin-antitoxin system RelE/ParE family toxin [Bacteroidetes bacterium]|nr:type II toxin-antitoxin system RelE/ParE family toxin [Bacteroidota bacterium]